MLAPSTSDESRDGLSTSGRERSVNSTKYPMSGSSAPSLGYLQANKGYKGSSS